MRRGVVLKGRRDIFYYDLTRDIHSHCLSMVENIE
jgi:hypothetical protein